MTLFIGGPLDGQRREMPKSCGNSYRVPVRRYATDAQFTNYHEFPELSQVAYVRYNKLNICGVEFFAEDALSYPEVMYKLVEHYR